MFWSWVLKTNEYETVSPKGSWNCRGWQGPLWIIQDAPGRSEILPYRQIQVTKYMLIHINSTVSLAKRKLTQY